MSVHRFDAPAVTINVAALECVRAPLVPVITSGYPFAVVLPVGVTVRMELPELNELGLKLKLAPAGKPLTLSVTAPVKLPSALTFTAYWMLDPEITAGGLTVSRKSCPLIVLTLSNVAVVTVEVSREVTARPM